MGKIKMFATDNPTEHWVICINSLFGYVTKEQAEDFIKTLGSKCIDNTAFGSWDVLAPNHRCEYIRGTREEIGVVSVTDYQPIDILDYVAKKPERSWKNFNLIAKRNTQTTKERKEMETAFSMFFSEKPY